MAKFEIGVHAILFDEDKRALLVHRRDMDLWDLPGGGMEYGELPTDAVIRETKEETGLEVGVEKLLAVGVGIPPENAMGFLFLCRIVGGEISIGLESDAVSFFGVDELPENLGPRKKAMIQLAIQNPADVVFSQVNLPKAKQYLDVYGKEDK